MNSGFDSIAWCYDFLVWLVFGKRIKQSQRVLFAHIKEHSHVLIIGGGTGWIVKELLALNKNIQIDYIESSKKMLNKAMAMNLNSHNGRVRFIQGNENDVKQNEAYDAILACYFFDLFPAKRLEEVVFKLTNSLKEEGFMLVADFNMNSSVTFVHKVLLNVMYMFFNLFCGIEAKSLVPLTNLFRKHNLELTFRSELCGGFIHSEVYIKK